MRRIILVLIAMALTGLPSAPSLARDATVNISTEDVDASDNQLAIAVSLPAGVVGKRINRAVLEVPIAMGESADSLFNEFPLLELYQDGSELPKQTVLLPSGFSGVARFDVTRFVREWSNTDAQGFVLGAVSEANATAFELGTASQWANGIKARLTIEYSNHDGQSVAVDVE